MWEFPGAAEIPANIWQDMERFGNIWGDTEIIGHIRQDLAGFGKIWHHLGSLDAIWPICGWAWQFSTSFAKDVAGFGNILGNSPAYSVTVFQGIPKFQNFGIPVRLGKAAQHQTRHAKILKYATRSAKIRQDLARLGAIWQIPAFRNSKISEFGISECLVGSERPGNFWKEATRFFQIGGGVWRDLPRSELPRNSEIPESRNSGISKLLNSREIRNGWASFGKKWRYLGRLRRYGEISQDPNFRAIPKFR